MLSHQEKLVQSFQPGPVKTRGTSPPGFSEPLSSVALQGSNHHRALGTGWVVMLGPEGI